jgi:hypothetical protein
MTDKFDAEMLEIIAMYEDQQAARLFAPEPPSQVRAALNLLATLEGAGLLPEGWPEDIRQVIARDEARRDADQV